MKTWVVRLLDRVPQLMRSWPFVKRFYWQEKELEQVRKRAKEIHEKIEWR